MSAPAYLEWLKQEAEKDRAAKQSGRPELPRSEQERAAILSLLPVQERRRIRNAPLWDSIYEELLAP
jgi:hypothetical protein